MNILVNYAGGTCGDFIRLCIMLGSPTQKFKVTVPAIKIIVRGEEIPVAYINDVGRVRIMYSNHGTNLKYPLNKWADANRFHIDGSLIKQLHDKKITIDDYINEHKQNIEKARSRLTNISFADNYIGVGSGHEIWKFQTLFGNIDYFLKFVEAYDIDKVVYIKFSDEDEMIQWMYNQKTKNDVDVKMSERDKYNARQDNEKICTQLREQDSVIPLANIYNREKLRKVLKDILPSWQDTYFDELFDLYDARQQHNRLMMKFRRN